MEQLVGRQAFGCPVRDRFATNHTRAHAKKREYGTGRAKLGLDGAAANQPEAAAPESPNLSEYLEFGRLVGDRAQQVQRQLANNGTDVVRDAASQEYLQEWRSEEVAAYRMFETLASPPEGGSGSPTAATRTLMRNKNRVSSPGGQRMERYIKREYGDSDSAPLSAAERKLAKNKQRVVSLPLGSSDFAMPGAASEDAGGYELLASSPDAAVVLERKPARLEYEDDATDEDWDAAYEDDDDEEEEEEEDPTEPLSYEDFAKALDSKAGMPGMVRLSLADAPRKPQPPAQLLAAKPAPPTAKNPGKSLPPTSASPAALAPKKSLPPTVASPAALAPKPGVYWEPKPAAPPVTPPPPPKPVPSLASKPAAPPKPLEEPPAMLVEQAAPAAPPPVAAPAAAVESKPTPASPPVTKKPALAAKPAAGPVKEAAARPRPAPAPAPVAVPPVAAPPVARAEAPAKPAQQAAHAPVPAAAVEPAPVAKPFPAPQKPSERPLQRPAPRAGPRRQQSLPGIRWPALPDEDAKAIMQTAEAKRTAGELIDVTIVDAIPYGVLAAGEEVVGLIPAHMLAPASWKAVVAAQKQMAQGEEGAAPRPPRSRFAALSVLVGRRTKVAVGTIDAATGRVMLSEKAAWRAAVQQKRAPPPSAAALEAAADLVGQVMQVKVMGVRPFGLFVELEISTSEGPQQVVGLVHATELSWESAPSKGPPGRPRGFRPEAALPKVGQSVQARMMHVDNVKGRIFLSLRRVGPNPLLETLDQLLASSAAAGPVGAEGGAGGDGPGSRRTADASTDLRSFLGDMDAAQRFADALCQAPGVASCELGVRLTSRAAAQDVEVYLAKADAAGEGATGEGQGPGALQVFKMVVRQGMDVQEVAVTVEAAMTREQVKALAVATAAALA